MREIKFRVWDPISKTFIEGATEGKSLNTEIAEYQNSGLILIQFTGLHAKNGTDIYEGDIAAFPNNSYTPENGRNPLILASVRFQDGCFCTDLAPLADEYSDDIEIIGNVWENPDLLTA
jgi:uncharacterized phage protein (TIGR01671 family)